MLAWQGRDAGQWNIVELVEYGEFAGVLVWGVDTCHAGRVLEVFAAKCRPGHYAQAIDAYITSVARDARCKFIRYSSPRPLHRLFPGFKPANYEYVREVSYG